MYIVSQTKHTKTILEEGKGRWGGEENVDAVSSVSQPLCQLFNLWLKLKSLALTPELTSLKQKMKCGAQGAPLIPCLEPYVWGWVRPFLGNTCIQYKSTASTNKLLPWALPPSCLLQDRFCFTRVLNFKWYTTKSARVVFCELFCGICIFVSLQLFLLWIQIYMILYYLYVWMELLKWDYSYFLCVQSLLL